MTGSARVNDQAAPAFMIAEDCRVRAYSGVT
jgi:hypothetical protein